MESETEYRVTPGALTASQLKEKELNEWSIGTFEDPEDEWEGASAPFDNMTMVPEKALDEGVCSCCFLIVLKSTLNEGTCRSCDPTVEIGY